MSAQKRMRLEMRLMNNIAKMPDFDDEELDEEEDEYESPKAMSQMTNQKMKTKIPMKKRVKSKMEEESAEVEEIKTIVSKREKVHQKPLR